MAPLSSFSFQGLWHLVTTRCNNFLLPNSSRDSCYHFYVDGHHLGFIHPDVFPILLRFPNVFRSRTLVTKVTEEVSSCCGVEEEDSFEIDGSNRRHAKKLSDECSRRIILEFQPGLVTFEERSKAVAAAMLEIRDSEDLITLRGWRNEDYGAFTQDRGGEALFRIERAACSILGLVKYGVHVNGYFTDTRGGAETPAVYMWIGQRSLLKPTWPGRLDNMAGGGLCYNLSVSECMQKECEEEASVPPDLFENIKSIGTISYVLEDERYIQPQVEYCFDLELPESFRPRNADGEVEGFILCSIPQVKELICDERFKPNSAMVILDFLFRHGFMEKNDTESQYSSLLDWMHIKIPFES